MNALIERLKSKYEVKPSGCWEWFGAKRGDYGVIRVGSLKDGTRRMAPAHRVMYEESNETSVPPSLEIDHLCKNKSCVNPSHLEAVMPQVNKVRADGFAGLNSRKTACIRGHAFDLLNTRVTSDGKRRCRACYAVYRARAAAVRGEG